ncbi:MAG TPA: bifunctional phosphoribosylaminoimidazolecarboxamide formyltransferase/inosine monophosphate cyclohydrolase [Balneola sp.]|nr:bifunctional phosphoribosylaminoimidazolecarboxamide formyltransferase/inosine monophosphate cyclohydrolase [Balneola sp.]MAO76825.1 bifunctional phosphoribosylaminoimidazolecarboxamide formyltransferase/inosine monophosphate cyclohydrolase [Balneola sp.]MBF64982.1 bifunctional phosphoribosylaminoimidazolecarboxamide formyltransferase/inosine monophosphate cyclohydrolase [Balneola sp.]HAH50486.1 bifunctional phosphoribosylaminoimidazolecarboxamide formyltransferase/inosine monophosphate cyclo
MALKPLSSLPTTPLKINRALLSVSDKTNIVELAQSLHDNGVVLISTGGTAKVISEAGIPVKDVSEVTGFQECLDGRVKTLHPMVHGGILARTTHSDDVEEIEKLGITPIELVVVNLYPFKNKIKEDSSPAVATEFIDIGGPTMIRAAAKNFAHVSILSNPSQYESFIEELVKGEGISFGMRKKLAKDAFNQTADYDSAIANYFNDLLEEEPVKQFNISVPLSQELRYGENPHQNAAVYGEQDSIIDCFHGKQLSYNNFIDVDAALNIITSFNEDRPTCAIIKHTIPCGVGIGEQLVDAYKKAFSTDTVSPFGGIVVVNKELDLETAQAIDEIFTEIIIAPSFSDESLQLLTQKKNRRLIRIKKHLSEVQGKSFRSIFGGLLTQDADLEPVNENDFKVVTKRKPSETEMNDLMFAWKVVRNVKSNAIVYAKEGRTLGIGSGQTSRVDSSEIAVDKAKKEGLDLNGSAIASDAFFPFSDGIEAAAKAGATSVIQPGGSIRDEEVIAKANEFGMTMIFTGKRHFKH